MAKQQTAVDLGLLVLRVGLGVMFLWHGWPKVAGGPEKWEKLGGATTHLGIDFAPTVFGALGAFAEFGGGILLIVGFATRPAAFLMMCTMIVAASMHLGKGDGLKGASHAIEDGIAFLALLVAGAGRFSLDRRIRGK